MQIVRYICFCLAPKNVSVFVVYTQVRVLCSALLYVHLFMCMCVSCKFCQLIKSPQPMTRNIGWITAAGNFTIRRGEVYYAYMSTKTNKMLADWLCFRCSGVNKHTDIHTHTTTAMASLTSSRQSATYRYLFMHIFVRMGTLGEGELPYQCISKQ